MKKRPPDRAQRYSELLQAAADRHHTVTTDSRAIFEAGVRLLHESMTARMVSGKSIDADAYMKVSEQLRAIIPPPEPVEVVVQIVDPLPTVCPGCGHQFHPKVSERMQEKKEAAIAALPSSDTTPAAAPEVSASTPVPARPAPPPPPAPNSDAWREAIEASKAAAERNPSMQAWMNAHGKRYGTPNPGPDPTSKYNQQGYNNSAPSMWSGYQDRRSGTLPATPEPHPYRAPGGGDRSGHPLPVPVVAMPVPTNSKGG